MRFSKTYFTAPWILAFKSRCCNSTYRLRYWNEAIWCDIDFFRRLQQHLPFTVLKLLELYSCSLLLSSCNSTYRLRYWNPIGSYAVPGPALASCNSTYRLRYWNDSTTDVATASLMVATALTVYGIETLSKDIDTLTYKDSCNSTYRLRYWNAICSFQTIVGV